MTTTPKKPIEVEAIAPDVIKIEWRGLTLVAPAEVDDWEPDALEALEKGQAVTAIRMLLGSTKYEVMRTEYAALHGKRPTVGDLGDLLNAVAQAYGFTSTGE